MKYLFAHLDRIRGTLRGKVVLLFLDYDGTLVPITDTPEKAVIPASLKILLGRLADNPIIKLAIISGRTLEDIKRKAGLKNAIYSGNHGLAIEGPKIRLKPSIPSGYRKLLEKLKDSLVSNTSSFKGVLIEDKGLSLSLHYRLVKKADIFRVKTIFRETVIMPAVKNKIRTKAGKMVLEIRPPIDWDKGKAVLLLLARQQFAQGEKRVFPIYIGDDLTDEDAFGALRNKGLTVFVGKPGNSKAEYYLKNTEEVPIFLNLLADLKHN